MASVDDDVPPSARRRLPKGLQKRLGALRDASEPADDSVTALLVAEEAAERYESTVDEALGLAAELGRSVDPVLPRAEVAAKWAGLLLLSTSLLAGAVHQLGLGDFMLRAFGVASKRARDEIPASRVAYEAEPPALPSAAATPARRGHPTPGMANR